MEVATIASRPTGLAAADRELIERHRLGDPSAFDEIFDRYHGMVFSLALRLSGDRERAAGGTAPSFTGSRTACPASPP